MTIETKLLKIFVAVYKSGSFTKAANLLATSQPAVSEHIKTMEKGLGCKLFDRLGRSIKPTQKAEILYPKALSILEDIRSLEKELTIEEKKIAGELIIGASTTPGAYILPQLAAAFVEKYPEISFEVKIADSGEIIESVLEHDLLIGVVGAKIPSANLDFIPLVEDELVLATKSNRKLNKTISLQKLFKLPFLLREKGSGTRKSMEEYGIKNGFGIDQLNTVAVLGSNTAIKEAIKADLGVSILSRLSISDELETGELKTIDIKGVNLTRMFYVVTQKKRTLPNHYTLFFNTLLSMKKE